MHLAQELLTNVQCSGGSRSFTKEKRALKMRRTVAGHRKLKKTTERIIKADPPTTTQEIAKELNVDHSTFIWLLKQTRKIAQTVKRLPTMRETRVRSLGWEDRVEKEMATHSNSLAWKIPWTEDPGRLQSMGSQRVRHD